MGGKLLVDAALTFGASSSPGLFDQLAELVLQLVLWLAGLKRNTAIRQLDDNVVIGQRREVELAYNTYMSLAKRVGVRVAKEEADKAFGPQRSGTILGLQFSAESWTWTMDKDKAARISRLLHKISSDRAITQGELQTLVGKLTFYHPLFRGGKFERTLLLRAQNVKAASWTQVKVTDELASQARWWLITMGAALKAPQELPDPRNPFPAAEISIFPDAAGGCSAVGSGLGAVVWLDPQVWVAHFWPEVIRMNKEVDPGANCPPQRLAYHTMVLEAAAALSGLVAAPERVRNSACVLYVDNAAVVAGYSSGNSVETLAWVLLKACRDVAAGLNVKLDIRKVRRCSSVQATTADLLSKGKTSEALDLMDNPSLGPGFISATLMGWLERPRVSRVLGAAILLELKASGVPVLTEHFELEEEVEQLVRVPRTWPGKWTL